MKMIKLLRFYVSLSELTPLKILFIIWTQISTNTTILINHQYQNINFNYAIFCSYVLSVGVGTLKIHRKN